MCARVNSGHRRTKDTLGEVATVYNGGFFFFFFRVLVYCARCLNLSYALRSMRRRVLVEGIGVRVCNQCRFARTRPIPSTTVVRDKLVTACTLGSRFFVIARLPYALYATRLRIYDFSPGARGRRYPDRSSVLNLDIHVGHLVGRAAAKDWDFSEDNSLIFRVSAGFPNPRILRVTA